MAKWARIINGNDVVEVTDIDPDGRYHPSLIWIPCPDYVTDHYTYDNGAFVPPPPPPPTTAQDLAPNRSLEGLTQDEIASLQAMADLLNTDPEAFRAAMEAAKGDQ